MLMQTIESDNAYDIYSLLDEIRESPSAFITDRELKQIESIILGYGKALVNHGIKESVPDMLQHFSEWIFYRCGWSTSRGWVNAIQDNKRKEDGLSLFFQLVDEFRQLKPEVVCYAHVDFPAKRDENIRPQYISIFVDKPEKLSIVRYYPKEFLFLRYHRGDDTFDGPLASKNGSFQDTLFSERKSAEEMYQIREEEWVTC